VTAEYELALNAVREATRKFKTIRDSFRDRNVSADEFVAARKVYDEADKVYEAAYAKEQSVS
jgi:hypothetical protein